MRHHGAGLRKLTGNDGLPETIAAGEASGALSSADEAMLAYARKLTAEPWNVGAPDIDELRRAGFSDAAILDICQVTAYYAYVNRLADGLGVELEQFWDDRKEH